METHQDQPTFHLFDGSGWVNDPNGPLYYNGKYHMFFQNVEDSTTWTWGLSWGHATSTDLLHWRQQPAALKPDPGWHDADGCFSGCATVDVDGRPAILYTGVRKKPDAAEREGMPMTVSKLCYETQLIARPKDPSDPDLKEWVKVPQPFLPDDMSGLPTHCFRDPFVLERPSESNGCHWLVMVGSNISMRLDTPAHDSHTDNAATANGSAEDHTANGGSTSSSSSSSSSVDQLQRLSSAAAAAAAAGGHGFSHHEETLGTATVYRSKTKELEGGWEFNGLLCVARPGDGAIWECPIMVPMDLDAGHSHTPPSSSSNSNAATVAAADGSSSQLSVAAAVGTVQQQKQQQQEELELQRAPSGCLGLWSATTTTADTAAATTINSSNSNDLSPGVTADAATPQQQQQHQQQQQQEEMAVVRRPPSHCFSVSAGVCPAIYWLGCYEDGRFNLECADGPHALDLGDVLYAPNLLTDAQGRQVLWAWLQDHPSPVSHDYAGCISLPRQLLLGVKHTPTPHTRIQQQQQQQQQQQGLDTSQQLQQRASSISAVAASGGVDNSSSMQPLPSLATNNGSSSSSSSSGSSPEYYLIQRPLPELDRLRSGRGLRLKGIELPPNTPWSLPSQVSASHLDLNLTLLPRPGVKRLQILLGPLRKHTAATPTATQQQQQQKQQQQQQQAGSSPGDPTPTAAAQALTTPQQAFVPVLLGGRVQLGATSPMPTTTGGLESVSEDEGVSEGGVSGSITLAAVADAAAAAAAAGGGGGGLDASADAIDSFVGGGGGGLQGLGLGAFGGFSGSGEGGSPPGSPTVGQEVLPWIPHPSHHTAAAAAGPNQGVAAPAASITANSSSSSSSSPYLSTSTSYGPFSTAAAAAPATDSTLPSTSLPQNGAEPGDESAAGAAAALAAAAAAEALLQEHWQAAALTYDWSTSQLQVLVGQPDALLKLLKQQADDLAAAEAVAAATAAAAGVGSVPDYQQNPQQDFQQQQQQQGVVQSRTGTPTPEKLGYQTPALPPAPQGALADSIAAAQAAGLRVLACQLRGLDEGEPLQLRLLLDYSILELFCGTGEALTTRVYRGAPTARAAEIATRKSAAAASALDLSDTASEVSMSGSLANLGLLLHHTHSAGAGSGLGMHHMSSRLLLHSLSANARLTSPRRGLSGIGGLYSAHSGSMGSLSSAGVSGWGSPTAWKGSPRFKSRQVRHSFDVAALPGYVGGVGGGVSSPRRRSFDPSLPPTAEGEAAAAAAGSRLPAAFETSAAADTSAASLPLSSSTLLHHNTALQQQQQQQQQQGPQQKPPSSSSSLHPGTGGSAGSSSSSAIPTTTTSSSTPFSPPPPLGSVCTRQAASAVPPSPGGVGPYVHYFSPNRSLAAKVTAITDAAALLPGLAQIQGFNSSTADAAAAGAAAAAALGGGVAGGGTAAGLAGQDEVSSAGVQQQQQRDGAGTGGDPSSKSSSSSRGQRQRRLFAEASFNAGVPADPAAAAPAAPSWFDTSAAAAGNNGGGVLNAPTAAAAGTAPSTPPPAAAPAAATDMFPGFSPHRAPTAPRNISSSSRRPGGSSGSIGGSNGGTGGSSGGFGGSSGGSTAGALVTWFQKKLTSKAKKGAAAGEGDGVSGIGSSSTTVKHQIVLPANFGVPPPSGQAAAAAAGGPIGAAASAAADAVSSGVRDQSKQQKGASLFTDPKLSSLFSSSSSSTAAAGGGGVGGTIPEAAAAASVKEAANGVLPPPSALPALQIRTAKKLSATAQQQQQQQQQGAGVESDGGGGVLSPTAGSRPGRPGSARAAARSPGPRRNWRSAFVFDEPEAPGSDPVATLTSFTSWPMGQQGSTTIRPSSTSAPVGPGSLSGPDGPGVGGPGSLPGPGGPGAAGGPGSDGVLPGLQGGRLLQLNALQGQAQGSSSIQPSLESEYGMYAQLLVAPGSTVQPAAAAAAAGMGAAGKAVSSIGSAIPMFGLVGADSRGSRSTGVLPVGGGGVGGVVVSLGVGAGSGGSGVISGVKQQSGYGVGAMRELSLVALGGGGVLVQRLEAYEMASMWDAQEGGQQEGEDVV